MPAQEAAVRDHIIRSLTQSTRTSTKALGRCRVTLILSLPLSLVGWAPTQACAASPIPTTLGASTLVQPRTAAVLRPPAQPIPKEQILHSFQNGSDGAAPNYGVVSDARGSLYGTMLSGGSSQCTGGCGNVYKLTRSGRQYTESVIYGFPQGGGGDPATPFGTLMLGSDGTLTGLSYYWPPFNAKCVATLFKLTSTTTGYTLAILHCFQPGDATPNADLIVDKTGTFYGTSPFFGPSSLGAVFKLIPHRNAYTESILYAFQGGSDGEYPTSGLVMDAAGSLYGTTVAGGSQQPCNDVRGCGTVFRLTPSIKGYAESVIHRFDTRGDGYYPKAPLILDSTGSLYGTTYRGGPCGYGTVFKLTPTGATYTESIIYDFPKCNTGGGDAPVAPVIMDATGALYGATPVGGSYGRGTVYKLTPSFGGFGYGERDLYDFRGFPDGNDPQSGLLLDQSGAIYATTTYGGSSSACGNMTGCGTVFKITP
jgi:uncharacterized repeat protein (TIGR03803 family)